MRLIFTRPARGDLNAIVDYIALENPAAAERVYRAIVESARRLTDFPNMGHAGRCPGTFEYSVTSLPYVIAYQVEADLVMVLAVFHAARNLTREIVERRSEP